MTELLTDLEFDSVVEKSRMHVKMKDVAKLVLVGGEKAKHVAETFNISRQAVSAAVIKVRNLYDKQKAPAGCSLVKIWLPNDEVEEAESRCRLKQMIEENAD